MWCGTSTGYVTLITTSGSWDLLGGYLTAGTLTETGGASLVTMTSVGKLSGMTVNGDLDLSLVSGSVVTIQNGLVLNGTMFIGNVAGTTSATVTFGFNGSLAQTFSGNATVLFGGSTGNQLRNDNNSNDPARALTFGGTVLIHGKSGSINSLFSSGFIINQGTIQADVAGGTFTFGGNGNVRNDGTLSVSGATLNVSGLWSNTSTITATNSTLNLGSGASVWSNSGTITAKNS